MSELAAGDRVEHMADRHRGVPDPGTVLSLYTGGSGTEYAVVKWNSKRTPTEHPVANLIKTEAKETTPG